MKILLLDNYDSFSRILFQYLWEVTGEKPLFLRNDEWNLETIRLARFDAIVISPGPGHPGNARDFGVCAEVIAAFPDRPILGVCLGLQGLGLAEGGAVIPAPAVRHGKHSRIRHDGEGLFAGLPAEFSAVRYHSLVLDPARLPSGLLVTATAADDGQIMAIRSAHKPFHGVQFHPESIGTEHGKALLANFRDLAARWLAGRVWPESPPPASALPVNPPKPPSPAESLLFAAGLPPARILEAIELPWRDPEAAFSHFFPTTPAAGGEPPAAFWLDSLSEPVPGETRVTYMGSGSRGLEIRDGRFRVLDDFAAPPAQAPASAPEGDPLSALQGFLRASVPCVLPKGMAFPATFLGGLVGWFGYELKRFCEGGEVGWKNPQGQGSEAACTEFPSDLPDAMFLQPDRMLAFDPVARKAYAILPLGPGNGAGGPESGQAVGPLEKPSVSARAWLERVRAEWEAVPLASAGSGQAWPAYSAPPQPTPGSGASAPPRAWELSVSKSEYLDCIRALQAAILRGETYEACLTNELRMASPADPFQVYLRLRRLNPAPYAAYLRFPQASVLAASPERFLKLDAEGKLASRPIKGTRPRGADPAEDAALGRDLSAHPKDRSENLMIVDLVRNDFGKVCALGSVRVPEMMKVEAHPTVWQLVSTVTGELERGRDAVDAVRACFPGGSMTGAPKKRTMELLAAAERRPRGIFSGALGYLGWDGAMDLGMVIRTLVHRDGVFRIGCGGAILAESDPEAEFAEAMLKASASQAAVAMAETR
ncbi:MAG: aminodeoxychorismate synthase component I [Fibrobacteria bacterium]